MKSQHLERIFATYVINIRTAIYKEPSTLMRKLKKQKGKLGKP